jgi:PAS domain S-box-containing protein
MSTLAQTAPPGRYRGAVEPSTVLIVEDEAVVARDLHRSLADMGYAVSGCVATSVDALSAVAERKPDVVLMDICIHGQPDGIATAGLLRDRFRVPVIFLTAYADEQTVARAALSEPYGYLVKPFTSREVRSAIEIARHKHAMDLRMAERERWFSTILRSIGEGVVACDAERRVRFMNPVAEQLTGWTEQEAVGRAIEEVVTFAGNDAASLLDRALSERSAQSSPADRLRLVGRGGAEPRAIDELAAPIVEDGALLGGVLVLRDVSERQRMQRQVGLGERLASLGTLAAGMCHEINNPLTFIMANAQFLESAIDGWQRQLRERGSFELADRTWKARDALDDLREGAERIRRIIADLSVFGRPLDEPCPPTDVRASVEWALRVSASQTRTRARVIKNVKPVPPVLAGEARLSQVLVNLLINAAHAIPEGDAERQTIRVATDVDERGRVVLSVEDSGGGIPAEILPHIFDPFFTTKLDGIGSGLGLATCHGIVQSLGGEIRVYSRLGEGSRFDVLLPPAPGGDGELPVAGAEPAPQPQQACRGRVLVVDEEPALLRTVQALLEVQHDVVTVTDARDALGLIVGGARFDLVLCDVMMPGWGGMDLYERVVELGLPLAERFVFVTGGAFTSRARSFLASTRNALLQKPFDAPALRAVVARVLRPG